MTLDRASYETGDGSREGPEEPLLHPVSASAREKYEHVHGGIKSQTRRPCRSLADYGREDACRLHEFVGEGKSITSLYSTNFDRSLDTMMEDRVSVGGTVLSEQNIFRFFTSCRHR